MLVAALSRRLPPRYVAGPRVHLGAYFEIDVASYEEDGSIPPGSTGSVEEGGAATEVWAPPAPTIAVTTGLPDQDEYDVRVYDTRRQLRLVAAVEIVSPANKDRPEHHAVLVATCAARLREQVCVAIVDVVTTRQSNLYSDLLELIGQTDPWLASVPPSLYAASFRWRREHDAPRLETWTHALAVGQTLPTLPLWLAENLAVPLELESSYEETCKTLRIP